MVACNVGVSSALGPGARHPVAEPVKASKGVEHVAAHTAVREPALTTDGKWSFFCHSLMEVWGPLLHTLLWQLSLPLSESRPAATTAVPVTARRLDNSGSRSQV